MIVLVMLFVPHLVFLLVRMFSIVVLSPYFFVDDIVMVLTLWSPFMAANMKTNRFVLNVISVVISVAVVLILVMMLRLMMVMLIIMIMVRMLINELMMFMDRMVNLVLAFHSVILRVMWFVFLLDIVVIRVIGFEIFLYSVRLRKIWLIFLLYCEVLEFRANLLLYYLVFFFGSWSFFNYLVVCLLIIVIIIVLSHNINRDRAHITIDQRHASLLVARYKQTAAATEAVAVVLACHAITSINRSENIAWQFYWLSISDFRFF